MWLCIGDAIAVEVGSLTTQFDLVALRSLGVQVDQDRIPLTMSNYMAGRDSCLKSHRDDITLNRLGAHRNRSERGHDQQAACRYATPMARARS